MTIFELMVRRLVAMNFDDYEHACSNGYVTINTSDNGRDPLGWWVPTVITKAIRNEVCRQRSLPA
jgi:hypothetical protein